MTKVFDVISVFFKRCFCTFTLLTLVYAIVGKSVSTDEFSKYISVDNIFSFFAFSFLIALSFFIGDFIKSNNVLRGFVNFLLSYASLAVVFFAGRPFDNYVTQNMVQNKGFSVLTISFFFVIIYVLCSLFCLLYCGVKKKLLGRNKEYKQMFEKH